MSSTQPQKPYGMSDSAWEELMKITGQFEAKREAEENAIRPADPEALKEKMNQRALKRVHENFESFKISKGYYDDANEKMRELEEKYGITSETTREELEALHKEHPELGQALKRLEQSSVIMIQRIDAFETARNDCTKRGLDISDIDREIASMKRGPASPKPEQEQSNDADFGFNRDSLGYDELPQSVQLSGQQQQGVISKIAHVIGRVFQAVGRALGLTKEGSEQATRQPKTRKPTAPCMGN